MAGILYYGCSVYWETNGAGSAEEWSVGMVQVVKNRPTREGIFSS
jgi:hypothetical protein